MNAKLYFSLFFIVLCVKLIALLIISQINNDFFGGENDSDYYHSYAIGEVDNAVNIWPVILRYVNELGLYFRGWITFILAFIGLCIIPFMVANLSIVKSSLLRHRVYWAVAFVVGCYPTLTYLTTDIYRDVVMVFLWLMGLLVFKKITETNYIIYKFLFFLFGLMIAYILYLFRPYLGFSYIFALFFPFLYSFKSYPLWLTLFIFLMLLQVMFSSGVLEPILTYRSIFHDGLNGGSNIGLTFSSSMTFIPDFLSSFMLQLLGFFWNSVAAQFVFLAESVPFIIMLIYLIFNRRYTNIFVDYLIVFFVTYTTIWLLGNDNLGTATRLRIFSYISVLIAFFVVYQNKKAFYVNRNKY